MKDQFKLFQEDSPVSHSVSQEKEQGAMTQEICGRQRWTLSKSSSQPMCTLRTCPDYSAQQWTTQQGDLFTTLERFSETWPKAGMTLGGEGWGLTMLELDTTEKGCGYWPSPAANEPGWRHINVVDVDGNDPEHCNQRFYDKKTGRVVQKGLTQMVEKEYLPTPNATEGERGPCAVYNPKGKSHGHRSLTTYAARVKPFMYPTPRVLEVVEHPMNQAARLKDRTGNKANNLASMAKFELWPTPSANEDAAGRPGSKMQKMLGNHEAVRGTTPEEWSGRKAQRL